jgi:hypothetical protein
MQEWNVVKELDTRVLSDLRDAIEELENRIKRFEHARSIW